MFKTSHSVCQWVNIRSSALCSCEVISFSSRALEVAKLSCQESCRAGELFDRIEGRQQKIAGKVRNEFF